MVKKLLLGIAAGLLSAPIGLLVVYLVGVIVIAATLRELFPTLLAAATALPLMLLFVLLVPTLVIVFVIGVAIGISEGLSGTRSGVYAIGAVAGLLCAELILAGVLRLLIVPQPGDFTSMVSNPVLAGVYGVLLGLITAKLFHWFTRV